MTKYFLPLVLLAPSAWAQGKTWAVVVGIDEYVRPAIPKLRYAVADAKLFARALQETMKIPADNIFLMTSDSVDENAQPRLTNVAFRLGWLSEKAQKDDTIIFYFAGHGMTVDGQPFLLTEESDNRSGSTLKVSALNGGDVIGTLRKPAIANVWVVLDACRNSPSGKSEVRLDDTLTGSFSHADVGRERTATMFACKVGERSWEWDEVKHGCYTYFLVDGLRRQAADPEGRVTMQGLSNYVNEQVPKATQKLGTSQNPRLFYGGAGPDQWVLAQVPAAAQKDPKKGPADTAKYVAQLDILQAKLDHEIALRIAAEQKANLEESRRLQLEQRLALLEKQVSGTTGLSAPKSEPVTMAYAERGVQDGALDQEVKRLQEENRKLNERLRELQGNLTKVGMVSRDVQLVEEQAHEDSLRTSAPADSTAKLQICLKIRDSLDRQLQFLESTHGAQLNTRPVGTEVAREITILRDRISLQRSATIAFQKGFLAAQSAQKESEARQHEAEFRLQKYAAIIDGLNEKVKELERNARGFTRELTRCETEKEAALKEANEARANLADKERIYEDRQADQFGNGDPWRVRRGKRLPDLLKVDGREAKSFGDKPK